MKFNCDKDQVQIVDTETDILRVIRNITESGVSIFIFIIINFVSLSLFFRIYWFNVRQKNALMSQALMMYDILNDLGVPKGQEKDGSYLPFPWRINFSL